MGKPPLNKTKVVDLIADEVIREHLPDLVGFVESFKAVVNEPSKFGLSLE